METTRIDTSAQPFARAVTRHPFGVVHVLWDTVILTLHPDDLRLIARCLTEWQSHDDQAIITHAFLCLAPTPDGAILWIGTVGLLLSSQDVSTMTSLLVQAAEALDQCDDLPSTPTTPAHVLAVALSDSHCN